MDKITKEKAVRAFEVRTQFDANQFLERVLGACTTCEQRANCNEIGNSSVCEVLKLGSKQGVLDLGRGNNAKLNTGANSLS